MSKQRTKIAKPLSFTTTLRSPERIAYFLNSVSSFEGKILTNDLINEIVKILINKKLYYTQKYQMKNSVYKKKYQNDEEYTDAELEDIILNSPQEHKEAGFDKGWASRFDTWYEFPQELGFIFYAIGKPIEITKTGHMMISAVKDGVINNEIMQSIFLNALMKYQIDNPFRRNAHNNNPLLLLLKTITILKKHYGEKFSGVFRQELPLFICWPDDKAEELAQTIISHRDIYKFSYGNEIIYNMCLKLLNTKNTTLYKIEKITKEAVDDYIRKMRLTGILSLRGNGRFLDTNKFEQEKIEYILKTYSSLKKFDNKQAYISYMGNMDTTIISIKEVIVDRTQLKIHYLEKWAKTFDKQEVIKELKALSSRKASGNDLLRVLSEPTRLEFLTSIALTQNLDGITVLPNYNIDDEGLPTYTASGGMADIECYDRETKSLFEVTLMSSKAQAVNEIPAITMHLKSKGNDYFAVFIAPVIHEQAKFMISFAKSEYSDYKVSIYPYTILEFVQHIVKNNRLKNFVK